MSDENDGYDYGDPKRSDYTELTQLQNESDYARRHGQRALLEKEARVDWVKLLLRGLAWMVIVGAVMFLLWLFVVILGLAGGARWAPLDDHPPVRYGPVDQILVPCLPEYPQCDQAHSPWRVTR